MIDHYYTLPKEGSSLYKVKGSKHLGHAYPIADEADAKEKLEALRKLHHTANHVCFAWSLGLESPQLRSSDDGEPANSAGPPILAQIEKYALRQVLVVVVRYFGGTKLGVGGLIDAYRTAAEWAIEDAGIVKRSLRSHFLLEFGYAHMSEVMLILRTQGWEDSEHDFRESCALTVSIEPATEQALHEAFAPFHDIRITKKGTY